MEERKIIFKKGMLNAMKRNRIGGLFQRIYLDGDTLMCWACSYSSRNNWTNYHDRNVVQIGTVDQYGFCLHGFMDKISFREITLGKISESCNYYLNEKESLSENMSNFASN